MRHLAHRASALAGFVCALHWLLLSSPVLSQVSTTPDPNPPTLVTPPSDTPAPVNQPTTPSWVSVEPQALTPSGVAVGRTRGAFGVTRDGGGQYVMPLWTPKGIAGLNPSLALAYSSQAGDGPFGVGWALSGLSNINRCGKTVAQDALAAQVFLTSNDQYCVDGNRLRAFSGTYGADGSQYQTELADFSLIISHGTSGTGPTWFEVHTKSGLILQYGNTAHSALIATGTASIIQWALNRVSDQFGNHIDFDYNNDTTNQVLVPSTITYTTPPSGSGAQATPNYQVQFTFQSRSSPVPSGFITGAQFMEPYLGQTITVAAWSGSAYVAQRTYNLTYTAGAATGRSTLTQVQECSPTRCFAPTTVGYQSGSTGWGTAIATTAKSTTLAYAVVADFNGDGIDDILYQDRTTGNYYYLLGATSGSYLGPYAAGITTATNTVLPIDYNADGKMDVLTVNSSGYFEIWSFTSAGSTFSGSATTILAPTTSSTGYVMVGDVDGDGRDDIIYAVSSGSSWTSPDYIYYRLNSATGFGAQQLLAQVGSATCVSQCKKLQPYPFGQFNHYNSRLRRADVNGDGRTDFFVNLGTCNVATGSCTSPTFAWALYVSDALSNTYDGLDSIAYTGGTLAYLPPLIGDFNGDGCSDIAYPTGNWIIRYGTCLRSGASFALSAALNTGVAATDIYPIAIDWDGDGRDDIVDADSTTSGHFGYMKSTGTGLNAWVSTGIAYNNADTSLHMLLVAGVKGDGQNGIVYPVGSSGILNALPHNGAGITQDVATSFVDGFGYAYKPTYVQITNSSYYTKNTGATYPEQDYQEADTVVASYSVSDGISASGTYTVSENYGWARTNIEGRGFEGFGYIRSLDSRNSLYTFKYYSLLFPETGMVYNTTQATTKTYATVVNTNTSATLDSTNKRYFPYVSQSVMTQYEYGGAIDGDEIAQVTKTYAYAGPNTFTYGNLSSVTTTTVDKDQNSPWPGQTFTDVVNITPYELGFSNGTGWCIHLSSGGSEQRTSPSGTLTHTTSSVVNHNGFCEVDSTTVEPSSTTDKVVTALAYDGCGNVNSTTVTGQTPAGTSMTPRVTGASYGTHCIDPETVTNPLTQSTLLGYDYNLGLRTSVEDPNLLTTSWTFNDIGQETLETRPDGTETSYGITLCTSCSSPPYVEYFTTVTSLDSTTTHAAFHTHYDYYDQLDRHVLSQDVYPGNVYPVTGTTIYDSLGRVVQTASPYFGGSGTTYFTTSSYDLFNRVTSKSRPINAANPTTLEYTYFTYQGRTSTVKDPKLYVTTKVSDVIGELSIVTDPDATSKTTYAYDPFSHLIQIKDPAPNVTTRSYDSLGYLLTGSSDPDRGTWTFQYDSLGELVNLRDAKTMAPAWTQQLTYDVLGRMTQRVEPEGTGTWTWGTLATNHEIGKLKEMSGLGDDELYTYDSFGRPYQHQMIWGGITYTIGYAYNTIGKLSVLTYPKANGQTNPFAVLYGYTNGYLTSLQNDTGGVAGTTYWELTPSVTNMDPWGHMVDETLGTTSAVRIQSSFDGVDGWINTRTVGSGGSLTNISNLSYQWDLNGNLSQREDVGQSVTEAITYDNLNRFQSSTLNGTANYSLVIDNTGNITSRTSFGTTYPYTYDTTHKHAIATLGGTLHTYTYDANGNQLTRDGVTQTWASFNLPTVINASGGVSATFTYGPDHQRKQQTAVYVSDGDSGTETTTYVGGLYEFEITPAQQHNKYFVQVPGGTQIIYDIQSVSGAQTTYITADHLGSASAMISSSGSLLLKQSYDAYGRRRTSNWSADLAATASDYTTFASTTRRGYTDAFHENLDNVALIHMNGRVYDPVSGRFLSPDPIVTKLGDSQRGNPYSYVENHPLRETDPTGLDGSDCRPPACKYLSPNGGWSNSAGAQMYTADVSGMVAGPEWSSPGGTGEAISDFVKQVAAETAAAVAALSNSGQTLQVAGTPAGTSPNQSTTQESQFMQFLRAATGGFMAMAWADSQGGNGQPMQEQGFIISVDPLNGDIAAVWLNPVASPTDGNFSGLDAPFDAQDAQPAPTETNPQWVTIGSFHTHPDFPDTPVIGQPGLVTSSYPDGPSTNDIIYGLRNNLPGVVMGPRGTYYYGSQSGSVCSVNGNAPGC